MRILLPEAIVSISVILPIISNVIKPDCNRSNHIIQEYKWGTASVSPILKGRRLVEEKYSWDVIGKKLDEVYTTACNDNLLPP
ncbi:MAG TPA: hypothetical protein ACFYD6_06225 [Candidatus Brocadiia bacterium]|nr:hypothetical protein [Planctomycetota bacterium]MDO8092491.1 hypothetical protein [Candidatus Brocadiales bacterium]